MLGEQRSMKKTNCSSHGTQGVGVACTHVAQAIGENKKVGFYTHDYKDASRPWAWCQICEDALVELGDSAKKNWMKHADFKILCAVCWDEAKIVCRGESR